MLYNFTVKYDQRGAVCGFGFPASFILLVRVYNRRHVAALVAGSC